MTATVPQTPPVRSCTFGPLRIEYDERVLEPRAWTLQQSTWAAELAGTLAPGPLLELCAGAGQIGLAAAVLADRDLVQVEADPVAAGFARANAHRAGVADRVQVRNAPMLDAVSADETFPLVLADPPYLPTADLDRWPKDPVSAIDGGADGLDLIRQCLQVAGRVLPAAGVLLLQTAGAAQVRDVAHVAQQGGFVELAVRTHDEQRAVVALRRA